MTEKYQQAKRKHHHIWANYLRRWSLNKQDVHYTTVKGNIVCESVKGIAMEQHFYQIKPLTNSHVEMIKGFSALSPKDLHETHMSYLEDFLSWQNLDNIYKQSDRQHEEVEKMLYARKCNMLENLHSSHENEVQQIIAALASRDLTILNDSENFMSFIQFFGHQITRTKTFKETVFFRASEPNCNTGLNNTTIMEECWWFLSYMFGMSIGADLYATRKEDSHCLLINDTDTPFITSDQPVVNVHQSLQDDIIVPPDDNQCDFYYPISPQVAYMNNKSDHFRRGITNVSTDIVNELNTKLAKKANVYIISNNIESLKSLNKYVGFHLKTLQASVF